MKAKGINNIKLGLFVMAGLMILITGLYLIGKDTNLFTKNYTLRARFPEVQGLIVGNNIRFAGIQVGTVKRVTILSDTVIEVTMLIEQRMQQYIHRNDIASIGTDGLVGNKLINLTSARDGGALAMDNDLIRSKVNISTEAMLETLDKTNKNLVLISDELKKTIIRINSNNNIWKILEDPTLPANISTSIKNIRNATAKADVMVADLSIIINDVKAGKGSVGSLLRDSSFAIELEEAVTGVQTVETKAGNLIDELNALVITLQQEVDHGKGPINAALKDSLLVEKIHQSLTNIEAGTASFTENMEALKHNFLFRGYFKKLEKEKQKEAAQKNKQVQ